MRAGLKGESFVIVQPIKFDIAVTETKEAGGGLKIHVVNAGGKYKAEEITKIQFEIHPE